MNFKTSSGSSLLAEDTGSQLEHILKRLISVGTALSSENANLVNHLCRISGSFPVAGCDPVGPDSDGLIPCICAAISNIEREADELREYTARMQAI